MLRENQASQFHSDLECTASIDPGSMVILDTDDRVALQSGCRSVTVTQHSVSRSRQNLKPWTYCFLIAEVYSQISQSTNIFQLRPPDQTQGILEHVHCS